MGREEAHPTWAAKRILDTDLSREKGEWLTYMWIQGQPKFLLSVCYQISLDKLDVTGHLSEIPPTARLKESNFLEHWTKAGNFKLLWQQKLASLKILTGTPEACILKENKKNHTNICTTDWLKNWLK